MLLAVALLAAWTGQALVFVGFKGWQTSALGHLMVGDWNPELFTLEAPPGGQPVAPGLPTPPAQREAPGAPYSPSAPGAASNPYTPLPPVSYV